MSATDGMVLLEEVGRMLKDVKTLSADAATNDDN